MYISIHSSAACVYFLSVFHFCFFFRFSSRISFFILPPLQGESVGTRFLFRRMKVIQVHTQRRRAWTCGGFTVAKTNTTEKEKFCVASFQRTSH